MLRAFFANRRWAFWAYGVGAMIFVSIYLQVQLTVIITGWYREFYDLIQTATTQATNLAAGQTIPPDQLRTVEEFWWFIFVPATQDYTFLGFLTLPMPRTFLWIAVPYVFIITVTNFVTRHYGFRWRQAITEDYIPRWRHVEEEIEGASQRIQEDANRFARIIETLGLQAFRALMTLIAFLPLLWSLSSSVDLPVIRDIPGSLVWAALAISVGGMIVSWFVGYFLPGLEYNNQKVEAAFRKELVYGEDDKVNYAHTETLFGLFTGIRRNYFRLYLHYGYFDLWINLYNQLTLLTPLLMMGPGMFTGLVTFGLFQQVSSAFDRVDGSFRIVLDNWTVLTELRSIWKRLHEFELNLDKFDSGKDVGDFEVGPDPVPGQ
ncbi:putative transporter [Mariluticola halotolerans]|uniref:putative transporter n=1 Tax=Mariluticola halotolerans TaxID=2909283 RepID=UPI0026E3B8D4|nr:putative transporter [Mariluticola halotolerans]UJQ95385.1 putative transporter [Mariluticola halotolerans]